MAKKEETLEYWENELYQIVRMHNSTIKVTIDFFSIYGCMYYLTVTYRKDITICTTKGNTLWIRYRDAVKKLNEFFGDEKYKHEQL